MPVVEKRTITPRRESFKNERKTREEQKIDSLSPSLRIMANAARKAGFRLIRDFGEVSNLQVSRKGPGDFVTNADLLAEKTLIEQLRFHRPDYGIVSEERGEIAAQNNSPFTWVIDPIDGTTNFLHAVDDIAVSIALMEKQTVLAGIVYNPIRNELYYAEKGKGAFLMTPTGNMRLRVSSRNKIEESLLGSNCFKNKASRNDVAVASENVASVRYNGSTTLSLAAVAAGRYDGYIARSFKLWDIAAGYLLVHEAGGFVSSYQGKQKLSEIMSEQTVVASNAALKQTFLSACSFK